MTLRDEPERYPVTASEPKFDGAVIGVRTDAVILPSGEVVSRDVVVHPGAVGIVAVDADDRVLLIRQYRHPPGRLLWEPPAGLLDVPGEPPHVTAARELYEEAGHRAATWHVLVDLFTAPGMSDEAVRIYLARDLTEVPPAERHEGEHEEADMPVAWLPLAEAADRIAAGAFHNPLAIVGILAALRSRDLGWAGLRPVDAPWPERPVSGVKG